MTCKFGQTAILPKYVQIGEDVFYSNGYISR